MAIEKDHHEVLEVKMGVNWGALIVPPGYTSAAVDGAGGNPYDTAHASSSGAPSEEASR